MPCRGARAEGVLQPGGVSGDPRLQDRLRREPPRDEGREDSLPARGGSEAGGVADQDESVPAGTPGPARANAVGVPAPPLLRDRIEAPRFAKEPEELLEARRKV